MGIRFQCHHCGLDLHVKDFQAGKRGRCPQCKGVFRVPASDAKFSQEISRNASSQIPTLQQPDSNSTEATTSNDSAVNDNAIADSSAGDSDSSSNSGLLDGSGVTVERLAQPPQVIREAPHAKWFIRPAAGGQYGPAPADVVWQWMQEDRIGVDSLVWRDDWPEWLPAQQVFADYYQPSPTGTAQPQPDPVPVGQHASPLVIEAIAAKNSPSQLSNAGQSRMQRLRSRKTKYTLIIIVLVILLIASAAGLVVVLTKNGV
jgi:hypothetical protein